MSEPPTVDQGTPAGEPSSPARPAPLWASIIRELSELSEARRDIASSLEGSAWPADTVGDLLLAMTELVVNALTHGHARAVDVAVGLSLDSRELAVTTRHVDRGAGRVSEPPSMPAHDDLSGRGRAVVAAVADRFDTVRLPGNEVLQVVRFLS